MNIPKNTRDANKTFHRENLNFPQALPNVSNDIYNNSIPVYDRNMFSMGDSFTRRNVENDRLMDSSAIFNNFANQHHDHYMRPVIPNQQNSFANGNSGSYVVTREKRNEKKNLDERHNMDRFFMTNRDYGRETMDRVNGFSIIPKDTRYDGQKKMEQPVMNMRSNRTTGMPFEKMN